MYSRFEICIAIIVYVVISVHILNFDQTFLHVSIEKIHVSLKNSLHLQVYHQIIFH